MPAHVPIARTNSYLLLLAPWHNKLQHVIISVKSNDIDSTHENVSGIATHQYGNMNVETYRICNVLAIENREKNTVLSALVVLIHRLFSNLK